MRPPTSLDGSARPLARCVAWLVVAVFATGCVGYVMGWSDTEVERLRRIVAELEAKNAMLVEEVIELRAGGPAQGRKAEPIPTESGTCRD